MRKLLLVLALISTKNLTAADPLSIYIKGDVGRATSDLSAHDYAGLDDGSFTNTSLDDSDTSIGLSAGYFINSYFSISVGYRDLGEVGVSARSDGSSYAYSHGPVSLSETIDGGTLAVSGHYPLNNVWVLSGTVGAFFWDGEGEVKDSSGNIAKGDFSGEDPFIGIGISRTFLDHWGAGVEYQRFDLDGTDVDVLAASLTYKFRSKSSTTIQPQAKPIKSASPPQAAKPLPVPPKPIPAVNRGRPKGNMTRAAEEYDRKMGRTY